MKNNQDLQKLKDDVFLQSEEYVKNRDKAESAKDYVSIRIVKQVVKEPEQSLLHQVTKKNTLAQAIEKT